MNIQSLSTKQFLMLAIGSAIFLRLLLMPFFSHVDLFSEYRRVHFVIDNEMWLAHGHRVLTFYLEMLFVGISKIFIPTNELTFYLANPAKSTSNIEDYFLFLQDPYVYRYLFFFKLPYLIFDLGVAYLIWRFIDSPNTRRIALLLWLFNPLTIFATYIFGRFEVFAIFFLVWSALNLKRDERSYAAVCFGLVLLCREIYVLLLPFFLLATIDHKNNWQKNVLSTFGCLLIVCAIYIAPRILISNFGAPDPFIDPDADHKIVSKLFSLGYYWFYPIVVGLACAAIYTWEIMDRTRDERFVIGGAIALLVYFAFNVHSVHYASWLVILPLLAMQYDKRVGMPFLALFICWFLLWLLKTDNGVFTPFLAASLSLEFVGTGHFPTWFNDQIATDQLGLNQAINIMKSLFAVVMGFMAYRLIKKSSSAQ